MEIKRIEEAGLKSEVRNIILRSLPLWFGIEAAIIDDGHDVKSMEEQ